jgi:hypothetical protein
VEVEVGVEEVPLKE